MRSRFDEQLAELNKELIEMGALCEEVIAMVSQALTAGDPEQARKVAPLDAEIDQKERSIESLCLKLLLQQQPVAKDLRQISAALPHSQQSSPTRSFGSEASSKKAETNFSQTLSALPPRAAPFISSKTPSPMTATQFSAHEHIKSSFVLK